MKVFIYFICLFSFLKNSSHAILKKFKNSDFKFFLKKIEKKSAKMKLPLELFFPIVEYFLVEVKEQRDSAFIRNQLINLAFVCKGMYWTVLKVIANDPGCGRFFRYTAVSNKSFKDFIHFCEKYLKKRRNLNFYNIFSPFILEIYLDDIDFKFYDIKVLLLFCKNVRSLIFFKPPLDFYEDRLQIYSMIKNINFDNFDTKVNIKIMGEILSLIPETLRVLNVSARPEVWNYSIGRGLSKALYNTLTNLDISWTRATLSSLAFLSQFKKLNTLVMRHCYGLDNAFLHQLFQAESIKNNLKILDLSYNEEIFFDQDMINAIFQLKGLKKLFLNFPLPN